MAQLNGYASKTGLSKTEVVVRAITSYLQSQQGNSLERRMDKVEQKIKQLEVKVKTAEVN